ncbi:hypothetical protein [uncultured Rhodospira sp.]|uniref:hypothetical protein n=1 Tax=uncultured Rhodospira sp. TaxID=1936189 RepID=UPI00262AA33F|nr:hypothetical protein [uncultured Rhodospira sp.]
MAKEMRRILLSEAEFTDALRRFVRARDQVFHGAALQTSRVTSADPLEVEVVVQHRDRQEQVMTLSATLLAAAVIRFCMEQRIPLPRAAEKSVRRVSGGVALDMQIDLSPG